MNILIEKDEAAQSITLSRLGNFGEMWNLKAKFKKLKRLKRQRAILKGRAISKKVQLKRLAPKKLMRLKSEIRNIPEKMQKIKKIEKINEALVKLRKDITKSAQK